MSNDLSILHEDRSREVEAIIESIKNAPEHSRHDYAIGRINSIGAEEKAEAVKYMSRLSNPTGVVGSIERAKYKLTELSNELTVKMELLMLIIDSPNSSDEIKDRAQTQLDSLTEFSMVALNTLAVF